MLALKLLRLLIQCMALAARCLFRVQTRSNTHGSARFASTRELLKRGFLNKTGLYLGRTGKKLLSSPTHGHLLCIAPTGTGKTTGFVLPNMLAAGGKASMFAIDPKGELFEHTFRNRLQFGPIFHWSPFEELGAAYNPLDFIRVGSLDERDDTDLLVSLLVPIGNNEEAFWALEARSLIMGLILYVLYSKPAKVRTMSMVRQLLLLPETEFSKMLRDGMAEFPHPIISQTANAILQKDSRQLSGVLATAQSKTRIWDSPRLSAATCTSDFSFTELKTSIVTVYISVPPEYLDTYYPAIRVLVGLAIAETSRTKSDKSHRTIFMLDEFANLGRLAPAEAAISIARSAGIQLCMFVQDISQFKRVYGDAWASFAANCDTKVFFGVNDIAEAKRLSETIGIHTVRSKQTGSNAPFLHMLLPDRISSGEGEAARPLVTPDEILNLPQNECLILHRSVRPIRAKRLFFLDKEFKRLIKDKAASVQSFAQLGYEARSALSSPRRTKKLPSAV